MTLRVTPDGYNSSPRFYHRGDFEFCIATTPKTGSTSLGQAARQNQFRFAGHPHVSKPIILVLRHPLDRLTSCYEFFVTKNNIYPGGNGRRPGWGLPFDQFVQYTETDFNMHWTPQTFQHPGWQSYHGLLPLKELSSWWPPELGEIKHAKKMKRKPWREYYTDEQFERQSARYAEDIIAYERAVTEGVHTG